MTEPTKPDPKQPASQNQGQLNFELPPDLEAIYSNVVRISHTPAELVLDFGRLFPGMDHAEVAARLVMSPVAAKLFFRALGENLARYESMFGEIKAPGDSSLAQSLFRRVRPPDKPDSEKDE